MQQVSFGDIVKWGLLLGLVLTIEGIIGNRVILRDDWAAMHAAATMPFAPPYPHIVRELVSISFDFVQMVMMVWVFSRFTDKSFGSAMRLSLVWWLATLALFYLAVVNSKMMPWKISLDTTIVGLVGALTMAPIMWWCFASREAALAKQPA